MIVREDAFAWRKNRLKPLTGDWRFAYAETTSSTGRLARHTVRITRLLEGGKPKKTAAMPGQQGGVRLEEPPRNCDYYPFRYTIVGANLCVRLIWTDILVVGAGLTLPNSD